MVVESALRRLQALADNVGPMDDVTFDEMFLQDIFR